MNSEAAARKHERMSLAPSSHTNILLSAIEHRLTRIEKLVAAVGLLIMLGISLLEIVTRNFFHTGIPGIGIVSRHLVLWVGFMGAVLAIREQRHIKIDLAAAWLPNIWRNKMVRPFNFISTAICGVLFWAAAKFWWQEWLGAQDAAQWVAGLMIILPASFLLLALHFFVCGIIDAKQE